jgi:hypothetical protein
MSSPLPPSSAPAPSARLPAARRAAILLAGLAGGLLACARPEPVVISAADVDRDRIARAEVTAEIAADHAALADLIASDRFADLEAIYADPELRAIALRLVERNRALRRLDDTNVLAPGAP